MGNLTRFDRWNAETGQVETVHYVINGANQIACIDDTSADGHCDDGETVWVYDEDGDLFNKSRVKGRRDRSHDPGRVLRWIDRPKRRAP